MSIVAAPRPATRRDGPYTTSGGNLRHGEVPGFVPAPRTQAVSDNYNAATFAIEPNMVFLHKVSGELFQHLAGRCRLPVRGAASFFGTVELMRRYTTVSRCKPALGRVIKPSKLQYLALPNKNDMARIANLGAVRKLHRFAD